VSEDPYVDPDTGVLVNRLGITDGDDLQLVETNHAFARDSQLQEHRLDGNFDVPHLQAFHRHLFGDVYAWAGEFRTVNLARTGMFGDWRHIREYLDQVFADLAAEDHLKSLTKDRLVARAAHYLGEVNAAHPFRDGNGRAQRAFFRQLLCDAGWSLRWSEVTPEENAHASEASLNGDNGPLEALLRRAITPLPAD
jgi:cell filamentation protein